MAVSSFGAAAGGLQPYEQIFTSSGTWTKPTGVKTVEITVVGGGANSTAGGGGAVYKAVVDVSANASIPVTVGSAGGNSSFGSYVTCLAGSGNSSGQWYMPSVPGKNYTVSSGMTYSSAGYISTQCSKVWNSGDGKYLAGYMQYVGGTYYYAFYHFPSSDGVNFGYYTGLTASNSIELWGYGAGVWIVGTLQNGQLPDAGKGYWTSPDGSTWTARAFPTNNSFYGMGFANGKWFAFPHYNTNTIYTSTDGYTWTSNAANMVGYYLKRIIYVNGYYYAQATDNSILWSSDGFNWTYVTTIGAAELIEHEGKAAYIITTNGSSSYIFTTPTDYTTVTSNSNIIGVSSLSGILVGKTGDTVKYSKNNGSDWATFVTGSGNGVVPGVVNNKIWGWAYSVGGTTGGYNTISGYFGQIARYVGNSYVGGGAGGNGRGASGVYIGGDGIDGFGIGGDSNSNSPAANFGGGMNAQANGAAPGLIRVRWWA